MAVAPVLGFESPALTQRSALASLEVCLNPPVGPPGEISARVTDEMKRSFRARKIDLRDCVSAPTFDYQLRPYVIEGKAGASMKYSYVVDVSDKSGARVFRINGEQLESVSGPQPWSSLSPGALDRIATDMAAKIAEKFAR